MTASQVTAELANGRPVLLLVLAKLGISARSSWGQRAGRRSRSRIARPEYGRTEPAEGRPAGAVD